MANVHTFEAVRDRSAPKTPSSLVLAILAIVLYFCVAALLLAYPVGDTSEDANTTSTVFIGP